MHVLYVSAVIWGQLEIDGDCDVINLAVQSGWSVCRTGNREKQSNSQVCCLAQLCLAAA